MNSQPKKPKVLCVDDEKRNLDLLSAMLNPNGYEVILADSGEVAIKMVENVQPDLILLDVKMPVISGYEVLEKIRKNLRTRLIPVVMVTSLHETADRVTAMEKGCDDFISKPFENVELLARVKSLLQMSYYRRQLDERKKNETIINEISDGIVICNQDWIISEMNMAAKKYLNLDKFANVQFVNYIYKKFSISILRYKLMNIQEQHKIFNICRPESNEFKPLILRADCDILKSPDQKIENIVLVLRDITRERREELFKQEFISLMSHKLRTPVMVITSYADAFLNDGIIGTLNETQKKFLNNIYKSTNLLSRLMDKLLKFSCIDKDYLIQEKHEINLSLFIPDFIKNTIGIYKEKKVLLRCKKSNENIPFLINGDNLELIFANLIENSIKFNDKAIIEIDINITDGEKTVEISFKDNGKGIPSEERDKIFDKFYQIEKFFTGQIDGVGLGLALVKQLVTACGGAVTLQSEIGKWTKFLITLEKPSLKSD